MSLGAREGEERGYGIPRSEEERQKRHEMLYPGTPLPPRGYGLSASIATDTEECSTATNFEASLGAEFIGVALGFLIAVLVCSR
jgi:hypothetical protein